MEDDRESSSLKHMLRSTICFSCCFDRHEILDSSSSKANLNRSSSQWLKSTGRDLPEFKEKCRNLISRIGRTSHQRRNSAEFRYDALSYALNFDEGYGDDADVELPLRNFSARLPASPLSEKITISAAQRHVVCV